MRLTLRTLLAYMDGILDPADQEDLSRQIQSSEMASDLVHRARDTTRRLRLSAPLVSEDPSGFDANAVAEYLDNTADPQAVADFEKHCLESDQHLAEVASCHHILTMVLGERAEVDAETRRRMYAIPEVAAAVAQAEARAAATAAQAVVSPTTNQVGANNVTTHEVPDYLRGSSTASLMRWLPAIAALLLLSVVAYGAFRPGGWLQSGKEVVAEGGGEGLNGGEGTSGGAELSGDEDPENPAEAGGSEEDTEGTGGMLPESGEPKAGDDLEGGSESKGDQGSIQPGSDASTIPEESSSAVEDAERGAATTATASGGSATVDSTEPTSPKMSTPEESAGAAATGAVSGGAGGSTPVETGGAETGGSETGGAETSSDGQAGTPEESQPPVEPIPVGQLASTAQVLLRYHDEDGGSWQRVPLRSVVKTGDRILSLPTYHPSITFSTDALNINAELVDGTLLEVHKEQPTSPVSFHLDYGRLVLSNPGNAPAEVQLVVGDITSQVRLEGRALLAVAAARPFVPGVDPMVQQTPMQAICLAPKGGVHWSSQSGDLDAVEPAMWQIAGDSVGPLEPLDPTQADWIDGRRLASWERLATGYLETQIVPGESVWPQLVEVFNSEINGMKERATLSAICSAHVGHFQPFVKALASEDQRNAWGDGILTLRAAMSRSVELAGAVKEAFVDIHGPERGDELYSMLCGYGPVQIGANPEQWKSGALRQLVEWLNSPKLEYRVLANYNIEDITDVHIFSPSGKSSSRDRDYKKLLSRLEDGKLGPKLAR